MKKCKSLNLFGLAKLQAILFGLLGLLAGVLYAFGGLIYDLMTIGLNAGTAMAFGALVGMPLIFAVAGFAAGLLEGVLFNLLAGLFGGIDFRLCD